MNPVRLAIAGAGTIGKRHLATIAASSSAELVGIADPFPAAQSLAADYDVACFESTTDLLQATTPDGVIIATPTEHHLAPTLAALDAGAHVLVEKPIAASLEEAEQIIARSAATGRAALVGHHRRYYPVISETRRLIQDGELGQLVAVSGQWTVNKDQDYFNADWRKKMAAGPVLTNLIHDMDLLRFICGDVSHVSAETSNHVRGYEKEDTAALVIRFVSGALGTFILSDATPSPWGWEFATGENPAFPRSSQNAFRFMGTEASLEFPNLKLWRHDSEPHDWRYPMQPSALSDSFGDAFAAQCEHFCQVIRGQETPRITADDATRTLRATLAVFDAAGRGRRIALARC